MATLTICSDLGLPSTEFETNWFFLFLKISKMPRSLIGGKITYVTELRGWESERIITLKWHFFKGWAKYHFFVSPWGNHIKQLLAFPSIPGKESRYTLYSGIIPVRVDVIQNWPK